MAAGSLLSAFLGWSNTNLVAQEVQDQWHFTTQEPADDWYESEFDAEQWRSGLGGFGTRGTPGSRVGTTWNGSDIWLRKTFVLESVPEQAALLIHHDEEAEVYLNGELIGEFEGYLQDYDLIGLDEDVVALLREGENLLAVHCHQTNGGQFIDAHIVDGQHRPQLP
ncbi:MAG: glycoside hydrolase family 2, partial [Planctomycetales bacterium]|nr:glycoside hydrolase family 2 [Planctomycetales bacterium]